jgi:putative phosphoribosyl transferase
MNLQLEVPDGWLEGELLLPEKPRGVVLFAHGSGSGRFSPRNQAVAEYLRTRGLATLLMDLLTPVEAEDRQKVFAIPLLAERLVRAAEWLHTQTNLTTLPLGVFGASTGAGAALTAAAKRPDLVRAVVSRGGRPDLATGLSQVRAPTLLIVGSEDTTVVALNQRALAELGCEKRLELVAGATHLFEEPGALQEVAALAGTWFVQHLHAAR